MDVLHPRCCGLDVHKSSISACILLREAGRVQKQQRRFGAMTQDLHELAEWLRQFGVTQIAMESSGVYWKPVWNILEGQFTVVLANAQHIKNVPGRKTDQKDAEWIAQLLQYGLLRASYVPCEIIRDLRDLTRMRARLSQEASRISSRIQKVLEDANLKLASVATNVLGKSGRAMLEDIITGEDNPEHLASARALKPMHERPAFGRSVLLYDRVDRDQLAALGEVRRQSIADLFVAVMTNNSVASDR